MNAVYALIDPREPEVPRYFGRTTQSPRRRLLNHRSAARFTEIRVSKKGIVTEHKWPVRDWIRSLQAVGIEPEQIVIAKNLTFEQAGWLERDFVEAYRDTVFNGTRDSDFNGGRKPRLK